MKRVSVEELRVQEAQLKIRADLGRAQDAHQLTNAQMIAALAEHVAMLAGKNAA